MKHSDPVRHVRFGNGNAGVFHFDPLTATDQRHSTRVMRSALSMSLGDFSAQSIFVTAVALCDFLMPPCWALSTIRWNFSILIYVFFGGAIIFQGGGIQHCLGGGHMAGIVQCSRCDSDPTIS